MRVVFAGSPAIAVPTLEALYRAGVLVGVLTNPDRPQGRGKQLQPTPVKEAALTMGVPIFTFETLRTEARRAIASLEPTLLVSFAYARIFGPKFLALFSQGGLNVHPSLLPKYRGASPLTETILQGDTQTGITIQTLVAQMDAGDIVLQQTKELNGTETTESLSLWAAQQGAAMITEVLQRFDNLPRVPQNHSVATYCGKVLKAHGEIDWTEPAEIISRKIRAYTPWPKCFTLLDGVRVTVLEAEVCAAKVGEAPFKALQDGTVKAPPELSQEGSVKASPELLQDQWPASLQHGQAEPRAGQFQGTTTVACGVSCASFDKNTATRQNSVAQKNATVGAKSPAKKNGTLAIQVATGSGILCITRLQKAGKKPLSAEEFIRGVTLAPDTCFGV